MDTESQQPLPEDIQPEAPPQLPATTTQQVMVTAQAIARGEVVVPPQQQQAINKAIEMTRRAFAIAKIELETYQQRRENDQRQEDLQRRYQLLEAEIAQLEEKNLHQIQGILTQVAQASSSTQVADALGQLAACLHPHGLPSYDRQQVDRDIDNFLAGDDHIIIEI